MSAQPKVISPDIPGGLDSADLAAVRRPLADASTLPAACYTSPEFHAREIERIFRPRWRFVGRVDEIAEPGTYRTVDTFAGPVIVVRGRDNVLHAFFNSCRHRGTQLLQGCDKVASIVCPYHAWTYGLDGALIAAPAMDRSADFDRQRNGLVPVRLETWGGFVWVNPAADGPSLIDSLGDLPQILGAYRFDEMVCVRRVEYDVACNWKLLIENALEEYHTGTVHRTSLGQQQGMAIDTQGDWDALFISQDTTIAVLPGETTPLPQITGLSGRHAHGTFFTAIYPALQFACTQDCMWWLDFQPAGPERTRLSVGFVFPREAAARPDFAEAVKPYYRRWEVSIGEDNAIGERQQKGMQALARPPGRFSWKEHHVHKLANWILDRVVE